MWERRSAEDEEAVRHRLARVLHEPPTGVDVLRQPFLDAALGLPEGPSPTRADPWGERSTVGVHRASETDRSAREPDSVPPWEVQDDPHPAALVDDALTDDAPPDSPAALRPELRARLLAGAFSPDRRGVRALAAVAVLVLIIAGVLAWQARPQTQPVAPPGIFATPEGDAGASTATIVVAVAGRVRRPGLVHLPSGSRVADAIEAAGGVLPNTDVSFLNLARKLTDGELLVVGVNPPGAGGAPGDAGGGLLNLNTATLAQLDTLPGVGPVLAQRILDYRTKHNGFRSVGELRQIDGLGDTRYEQLRPLVTV